ncbi:sialate O-acetylesterase [Dysgonomonas macrotermitis]|uniref:Sialate O-acetylesterase n=1 Tax=Dysgonomonas macrotermitis TaxID=1346286 RepID=A0A1M5JHN9_9BACT|nr:sialate O-acetylesterase [Dysgonomonas macrotermitis]SHG40028.1 sialate O-acetylesterase [Dysgonomonas macrotermitis]
MDKIINICIIFFLSFIFNSPVNAKVKLPVLVSDGMVLQREQPIKIWGWAEPGEKVEVNFLKKNYATVADGQGNWFIMLQSAKAGGPYIMKINDIELKDILLGDVFLCAGQSNMETTIQRIMDMFSDEILSYENTNIRHVKLQHDYAFQSPKKDIKPTVWRPVTKEYVMSMTGVPYFFAKFLYEEKKIPVGLVNTAVGGSSAEAWVSEEYLKNYPHYLRDLEICKAEGYVEAVNSLQDMRSRLYNQLLNEGDAGLKENWKNPVLDDSDWNTVDMFSSWGSDGVNAIAGSHWLRKNIRLPAYLAGKKAVLRLGTIIDSDSVFVNGVFVGNTTYQYPPRIYQIPENLLKAGENTITIRVFSSGRPHFVEDKPYKIVFDNEEFNLLGNWKHRVGCRMFPIPGGVGFSNKATVLYNAMIAPLKNMTFKGVLWYQGESNTSRYNEYYGIVENMIQNWRDLFGKPELPFIIAQLPNFTQVQSYPTDGNMAHLRDVQLKLSQNIPNVGLTVNIDLGEWNDIHPLNKKDVGYRMALQAEKLFYGNRTTIADGPAYESQEISGNKIILTFRKGTDDLMPVDELKGFAIAGKDGRYQWAKAKIENGKVIVWNDYIAHPETVRYAWADNPGEVNLRNKAGLPASPFMTEQLNNK